MLKYINSTKLEHVNDVRNKYDHCKVLMTDLDISDMSDITGYVYAISTSEDTFNEICEKYGELHDEGKLVMIVGSYCDGFICGMPVYIREIEPELQ